MARYAKGKKSYAISDRGGQRVRYTQLKTTWDGLRTGAVGTETLELTIAEAGVAGTGAVGTEAVELSIAEAGVAGTGATGVELGFLEVTGNSGNGGTGGVGVEALNLSITETGVAGTGAVGNETIDIPAWGFGTWGSGTWGN